MLSLEYARWRPDAFGVGVHRWILFDALWDAVAARGVTVRTGVTVTRRRRATTSCSAATARGRRCAATGRAFGARRIRPYPWGALWTIVDDPDERYGGVLHQTYRGTREMVGTLPSGRPDDGPPQVSLFVSLMASELDRARADGLDALKASLLELAGERLAPALDRITSFDQFFWAGYHDVVLGGSTPAGRRCSATPPTR